MEKNLFLVYKAENHHQNRHKNFKNLEDYFQATKKSVFSLFGFI